jgi:hypothetical protein
MACARPVCAGCQQRDRRIAELEAELQRLRQLLDQSQRDTHRQAHPFRRPEGSDKPRKPGRRKGHRAYLRPTPTPDQIDRVIHVSLDKCPLCQVPLYELDQVVQ